ncbi:SLC13 family permease [Porphyromonas sp. HMSC065F10]|uniref:SLC13 family permease n=1 Tax=Porphyromonas sp. HMSC065F10 TaxID=1739394 RepID=UPI0008A57B2D|nr:SLC13 family permease [Porphyromonas sp. HMSC065F10]OFR37979.1 citrate transporter [Porphyromonas sp. HMSC065F10]
MVQVLIILLLTAVLLMWGRIRSDVIALCSMLALVLTGIITPEEGLAGFSNSVVIMIAGLFIVGGAITQTGLARLIGNKVLSLAGESEVRLFYLVIMVTILLGLFVSNTGTVAILMPIVVTIASQSGVDARRLLMPMAFACSISGMMTMIGTPPTLIVHNALIESGREGLQFFTTLPVGLIILLLCGALLWPLSKGLSRRSDGHATGRRLRKSPEQLSNQYNLLEDLYRLRIEEGSNLRGKSLSEADLTGRFHCSVIGVKGVHIGARATVPTAETTLERGFVLHVSGAYEDVQRLAEETGLAFLDEERPFSGQLSFSEYGLAEVVVKHSSRLIGMQISETKLRQNYGISIVGLQRHSSYITQRLSRVRIHEGDMMLVQGTWEDIERLGSQEPDLIVLGEPSAEASKAIISERGPLAAVIILLMILAMIFEWLPPVIAVLLADALLILTRCFRSAKDAISTISWESVILFACMMSLATAMDNTGLSTIISGGIVSGLGAYGPYAVLGGIMLGTQLLSMFISNTATAVLFAPIALQAATGLGVDPLPFMIGVTVSASMCFMSPISTTPNAMVMSVGRYSFMDYVRVGLPLQIIVIGAMIWLIPMLYPM